MDTVRGKLELAGTTLQVGVPAQVRILLDGDTGDILVGGNGRGGDIALTDDTGKVKIRLDAGGQEVLSPLGPGSGGIPGGILVAPAETILLSSDTGTISVGGHGPSGKLCLYDNDDNLAIHLDAGSADMTVGSKDASGDLRLVASAGTRIHLGAAGGDIWLGGNGKNGDLMLLPASATGADVDDYSKATIRLDAGERTIRLKSPDGKKDRIQLIAADAMIVLGGNGANGDLLVFATGAEGEDLDKRENDAAIWIRGETGDIRLANGDCAEDFDVSGSDEVEPGTVMVLDREGKLVQSTRAYDKKVAGVISGAGDHKPGIVLDSQRSQDRRLPVALVGKAYCKVDAQYAPIEVGDLLTTSPTPGHAMKANDPLAAFGAVIGKALRPLDVGSGLIPVLIALQ